MDLALLVYAISLLEGFKIFFAMMVVTSLIAVLVSAIFTASWKFDGTEYSWNLNSDGTVKKNILAGRAFGEKIFKYSLICLFFSTFVNIFLPSEKTAYIMVGAYATQKVAENDKVQETGKKVLSLIEQKLDSYIEEGMKEVSKTKKAKKDE